MREPAVNRRRDRGGGRAPVAATPIAFVHAILRAYRKYGADPAEALRLARIAPEEDAHITAAQLEAFASRAMCQLNDEALGFFSRKLPWGSYGMLVRASLTAPDLGVALKRWCRHHRLLTGDITFELTVTGSRARLAIRENAPLQEMREPCLLTSLRQVHGFACWVIDSRIPLQRIEFPFRAPQHAAVYQLLFPGPVRFSAPQACITLDSRYLALPLRRDDRALRKLLRRALPLTLKQYRSDRLLVRRLRDELRTHCRERQSGEAVARALNVSLRTLHRRLREEGASLQKVKDEVRRDLAIERMVRTSRSIKQIARDVGFQSEKSFMRAFKQWTGESPLKYCRKAIGRGAPP